MRRRIRWFSQREAQDTGLKGKQTKRLLATRERADRVRISKERTKTPKGRKEMGELSFACKFGASCFSQNTNTCRRLLASYCPRTSSSSLAAGICCPKSALSRKMREREATVGRGGGKTVDLKRTNDREEKRLFKRRSITAERERGTFRHVRGSLDVLSLLSPACISFLPSPSSSFLPHNVMCVR